jgi:hypothetical protein
MATHHLELRSYVHNLVKQRPDLRTAGQQSSKTATSGQTPSPSPRSSAGPSPRRMWSDNGNATPRRKSIFDRLSFSSKSKSPPSPVHTPRLEEPSPTSSSTTAATVALAVDAMMQSARPASIDDGRWRDFIVNVPFTFADELESQPGATGAETNASAVNSMLREAHGHADPMMNEYLKTHHKLPYQHHAPAVRTNASGLAAPAVAAVGGEVIWKKKKAGPEQKATEEISVTAKMTEQPGGDVGGGDTAANDGNVNINIFQFLDSVVSLPVPPTVGAVALAPVLDCFIEVCDDPAHGTRDRLDPMFHEQEEITNDEVFDEASATEVDDRDSETEEMETGVPDDDAALQVDCAFEEEGYEADNYYHPLVTVSPERTVLSFSTTPMHEEQDHGNVMETAGEPCLDEEAADAANTKDLQTAVPDVATNVAVDNEVPKVDIAIVEAKVVDSTEASERQDDGEAECVMQEVNNGLVGLGEVVVM